MAEFLIADPIRSADSRRIAGVDRPVIIVAVLAVIYSCAFVDRQLLTLLTIPIATDLGIGDFQMSLLLGLAFSLFYGILNIPAGILVDKGRRRGLIVFAAAVWSIMTVVCGLSRNFGDLFFARAGVGIAEAFVVPACFSLLRDRVPVALRARAFSVFGMAPYIGSAIALSGGAALVAAAEGGSFAHWPFLAGLRPWQVAMIFIGVVGAPVSLLLLLLRPDRRVASGGTEVGLTFGDAMRYMRDNRAFYTALIAYVTLGAAIAFGRAAWTPAMMARRFGLPVEEIGYVLGPLSLASGVGGLFLTGWLLDHIAKRRGNVILASTVIMAICTILMVAMPLATSTMLAWILYGLGNLFAGAFFPIGATLLSKATPAPLMGKVTSIYLLFQNVLGAAVGPMLIALAGKLFAGPSALAYGMSLYFLGAGLLAVLALHLLNRADMRRGAAPAS